MPIIQIKLKKNHHKKIKHNNPWTPHLHPIITLPSKPLRTIQQLSYSKLQTSFLLKPIPQVFLVLLPWSHVQNDTGSSALDRRTVLTWYFCSDIFKTSKSKRTRHIWWLQPKETEQLHSSLQFLLPDQSLCGQLDENQLCLVVPPRNGLGVF